MLIKCKNLMVGMEGVEKVPPLPGAITVKGFP